MWNVGIAKKSYVSYTISKVIKITGATRKNVKVHEYRRLIKMASLSLKNVCKVYPNGFEAVKDFNLEIADKEFIIFVGPSG